MKNLSRVYLALLFMFGVTLTPCLALATDGQIKIAQTSSTTFPIVIENSGSYVLTSNIVVASVNAIRITANNVTLDLNGHTITAAGALGINSNAIHNITIKNGTVTGCSGGIEIIGYSYGNQISEMNISDNGIGGGVIASNAVISNCTMNNNGNYGINAGNSIITNCTANYNSMNSGIVVYASTVINCVANGNHDYAGIQGSSSIIKNCTAAHNDYDGILAQSNCRVESNNTRHNGRYGLSLGQSNNYAIKNTASDNGTSNFYSYGSNHMPTTGNNANIGW